MPRRNKYMKYEEPIVEVVNMSDIFTQSFENTEEYPVY